MKLVFISSPLTGDNEEANKERARRYCRLATAKGFSCCAPHLFFTQFLADDDPAERRAGLEYGLEWLRRCDEVWFFAENEEACSPGMREELALAKELRKPYVFLPPEA